MDNLPLFNIEGKLNPSITIVGNKLKLDVFVQANFYSVFSAHYRLPRGYSIRSYSFEFGGSATQAAFQQHKK